MSRLRTGVLISGRGSNLAALIEAQSDTDYPAEIAVVISNNADALGLERARAAGIEALVVDHRGHARREDFEAKLDAALRDRGVELICLAGFMRLLTPWFFETWGGRILNIHPSLLPAFKGLDTHARALEAGVRLTGCTVHYVVPEMDAGPIIAQAAVAILSDDNPDRLADRVLTVEHQLYPHALRLVAEGRVRLVDGRVELDGDLGAPPVLINPPLTD